MIFAATYPQMLADADLVMARFTLEPVETCRLGRYDLLGLRGGLRHAGRELFGAVSACWFDPPLSTDPQALRRFQKPAPAFVLRPQLPHPAIWEEGDPLLLEVLFLGSGVQYMNRFAAMLGHLGESGRFAGGVRFSLTAAHTLGAAADWQPVQLSAAGKDPALDVLSLGWWLDACLPLRGDVTLTFATPSRLVANGRCLRRPRFPQLFPFMLRRVTSMLYHHCGLEPVTDHARLVTAAAGIETSWRVGQWVDWQECGGQQNHELIGGLTGEVLLSGGGLEEIGWVVALASLFGIGRGAAFGAGRLLLCCDSSGVFA